MTLVFFLLALSLAVATVLLLFVLVSSSSLLSSVFVGYRNVTVGGNLTIGNVSVANVSVSDATAGNVNATLTLGPLGYCLMVSESDTPICSNPKFLYTIDSQVLDQVKFGTFIIKALSITNVVALIGAFGACFTLLIGHYSASDSPGLRKVTILCGLLSGVAVVIELSANVAFIESSPANPGGIEWLGLIPLVLDIVYFPVFAWSVREMGRNRGESRDVDQPSAEEIDEEEDRQLKQQELDREYYVQRRLEIQGAAKG